MEVQEQHGDVRALELICSPAVPCLATILQVTGSWHAFDLNQRDHPVPLDARVRAERWQPDDATELCCCRATSSLPHAFQANCRAQAPDLLTIAPSHSTP